MVCFIVNQAQFPKLVHEETNARAYPNEVKNGAAVSGRSSSPMHRPTMCFFGRLRHMSNEAAGARRPGHAKRKIAAVGAGTFQRSQASAPEVFVEAADRRI